MSENKLLANLEQHARDAFKEAADKERRRAAKVLMDLAAAIVRGNIDGLVLQWTSGEQHVRGQVMSEKRGMGCIYACLHDPDSTQHGSSDPEDMN